MNRQQEWYPVPRSLPSMGGGTSGGRIGNQMGGAMGSGMVGGGMGGMCGGMDGSMGGMDGSMGGGMGGGMGNMMGGFGMAIGLGAVAGALPAMGGGMDFGVSGGMGVGMGGEMGIGMGGSMGGGILGGDILGGDILGGQPLRRQPHGQWPAGYDATPVPSSTPPPVKIVEPRTHNLRDGTPVLSDFAFEDLQPSEPPMFGTASNLASLAADSPITLLDSPSKRARIDTESYQSLQGGWRKVANKEEYFKQEKCPACNRVFNNATSMNAHLRDKTDKIHSEYRNTLEQQAKSKVGTLTVVPAPSSPVQHTTASGGCLPGGGNPQSGGGSGGGGWREWLLRSRLAAGEAAASGGAGAVPEPMLEPSIPSETPVRTLSRPTLTSDATEHQANSSALITPVNATSAPTTQVDATTKAVPLARPPVPSCKAARNEWREWFEGHHHDAFEASERLRGHTFVYAAYFHDMTEQPGTDEDDREEFVLTIGNDMSGTAEGWLNGPIKVHNYSLGRFGLDVSNAYLRDGKEASKEGQNVYLRFVPPGLPYKVNSLDDEDPTGYGYLALYSVGGEEDDCNDGFLLRPRRQLEEIDELKEELHKWRSGKLKVAAEDQGIDDLQRKLALANEELGKWRNGELRFVPEVIDVDSATVSSAVITDESRAREKRPLEAEDTRDSSMARAIRIKQEKCDLQVELDEQNHQCGMLIGQGSEFNLARGSVFGTLQKLYPPDTNSPVPWRTFGEIDCQELIRLGLREEDFIHATAWQCGFWLCQPESLEETPAFPPFIATWVFIKQVSDHSGREVVEYTIREEDEILEIPLSMPLSYTGPPHFATKVKSAAFVKHLRRTYKQKADALLRYLLDKFKEYERHSGGIGFTGYSVIRKVWDHDQNCEMSLNGMLQLLLSLKGTGR